MKASTWAYQIFCAWGGFCLSMTLGAIALSANEWTITINAIDSRLGHVGGNRYIFLNIFDPAEQHLFELATDNIALKINQEPHLPSNLSQPPPENRIALLLDVKEMAKGRTLEMIRQGLQQFMEQNNPSDEIYFQSNGGQQGGRIFNLQEPWGNFLEQTPPSPEKRVSTSQFILQELQSFPFPQKRQWAILIASNPSSQNAEILKQLAAHLVKSHTTLIAILAETPASGWLKTLAEETYGSVYELNNFQEFPRVLQKVRARIDQEYRLAYQLNTLGNVPHTIDLKLISTHGEGQAQVQIPKVEIWPHPTPSLLGGLLSIGGLMLLGWGSILLRRWQAADPKKQKGFAILTSGENFQFIPLNEKFYALDFLTSIKTKGNLRLSANLGKVVLTAEENSYFLEDKNYKNALLINKRRVRRTLLRHGDILDLGELTLIYLNHGHPFVPLPMASKTPPAPIYYDKPQGPIRKQIGVLTDEGRRQDYYLVKNITFIGRSKTNNIILDSPQIALRHAKIVKIGTQYKLHSLSNQEGSFVNRRRIEQRFLKDGDEVSFENYQLRFRIAHNPPMWPDKSKYNPTYAPK